MSKSFGFDIEQAYKDQGKRVLKEANGRSVDEETLLQSIANLLHGGDLSTVDIPLVHRSMKKYEMKQQVGEKGICTRLSLTDIGSASSIGGRTYQEDTLQVTQRNGVFAAAVFDGHCGDAVSKRLAMPRAGLLNQLLQKDACLPPNVSQKAIENLFMDYDAQLDDQDAEESGSTAVLAIQKDGYIALYNVGDSRACVFDLKTGRLLLATRDHKLESTCEMRRVLSEGGEIEWDDDDRLLRVKGHLAMSRAFGDHEMGRDVVTARPDVYLYRCEDLDCASIGLVLGSDGVWDQWKTGKVGKLLVDMSEASSQQIADRLVQVADLDEDSDNTTAIVARFISEQSCIAKRKK